MEELSELTKLKILILEKGVNFSPITMFNGIPNIDNYKVKTINKQPVSNGREVFDISKDESLIPSEILLKHNNKESLVKCRYQKDSPVKLIYKDGQLRLEINDKTSVVKCELIPKYVFMKIKITDDSKLEDYIDIVGMDRISILLFEGCYNWICGKQCKFCDLHPKKETDKVLKPSLNTLYKFSSVEDWWNHHKKDYFKNVKKCLDIILKFNKLKHNHLVIMAGNLINSTTTWNCLLDLTKFLYENYDMSLFDSYVNVCPHPDIDGLKRLKKYGIKQVQYNLEVTNQEIFSKICPGKTDYQTFKNKLFEAVKIFGRGKVRSNIVFGLQDYNELLSDAEFFAQKGVVIDYSVFQPKKGTPLENQPSPEIKQVVDFTENLARIYKKYNYKPIYCSVSSRSSIINEVFSDIIE